jgi:hypothetical protein
MKNSVLTLIGFLALFTLYPPQQAHAAGPYYWYQIQNRYTTKCLHQYGYSLNPWGRVSQWDCINQDNVKLRPSPTSEIPYLHYLFKHSKQCVIDNHLSNVQISQYPCGDYVNEKIMVIPIKEFTGYYYLKFKWSGKCVGVPINKNDLNINQYTCPVSGRPNSIMAWRFNKVDYSF